MSLLRLPACSFSLTIELTWTKFRLTVPSNLVLLQFKPYSKLPLLHLDVSTSDFMILMLKGPILALLPAFIFLQSLYFFVVLPTKTHGAHILLVLDAMETLSVPYGVLLASSIDIMRT